jgi:hypothetical protein
MTTIPEVAESMQRVLTTTSERIARQTGFVKRDSKLNGALFVQTMVLGCLRKPETKLGDLTQTAASLHLRISNQGLDQRFTPAAAHLLKEVLDAVATEIVAAEPVAIPLLQRFSAVIIQDGSTIALPDELATVWRGCGGSSPDANTAALKMQVRFDLLSGALQGPFLQDGRAHDQSAILPDALLPNGVLHLNDLGYFSLDAFSDMDAHGGFFLSRLKVNTVLYDAEGQRFDLASFLKAQLGPSVDLLAHMGAQHHLAVRLIAIRVAEAVANERRRKLKAEARRKGQTVSEIRLALADWTILVTNMPKEWISLQEALVLARARWQIELLFKLWKQVGLIDEWRSKNPYRILCELYGKLIAMVIQHWMFLVGSWAYPDRSLMKAAETVQSAAFAMALAMTGTIDIATVIGEIGKCLEAGCRINTRKKHPNTYQLLLGLDEAA